MWLFAVYPQIFQPLQVSNVTIIIQPSNQITFNDFTHFEQLCMQPDITVTSWYRFDTC